MKKIIFSVCIICFTVAATAQPTVRIGNMEIIVRYHGQDTTMQVNILEDKPPISQKPTNRYNHKITSLINLGFVLPFNNSNSFVHVSPISSINLDFGAMYQKQFSNRLATGVQGHYSYYNYRMQNLYRNPNFIENVMSDRVVEKGDVNKQVFRSHNYALGLFVRYYISTGKNERDPGIYVDLGTQGDFAISKFYKLKTFEGHKKYRNTKAFCPATASVFARVGLRRDLWTKNGNTGDLYSFYVRYRLTNVFNQNLLPIDLPPITFGIVIMSDINF